MIASAHGEFSRMNSTKGASQRALSDVCKMRRRASAPLVRCKIAQRADTVNAFARRTPSTRSIAEPITSPSESECGSGTRYAREATPAAASNPPTGGSHLKSGRGEEEAVEMKALMLKLTLAKNFGWRFAWYWTGSAIRSRHTPTCGDWTPKRRR